MESRSECTVFCCKNLSTSNQCILIRIFSHKIFYEGLPLSQKALNVFCSLVGVISWSLHLTNMTENNREERLNTFRISHIVSHFERFHFHDSIWYREFILDASFECLLSLFLKGKHIIDLIFIIILFEIAFFFISIWILSTKHFIFR